MGQSDQQKARIAAGAMIEGSQLQGPFTLGEKTVVKASSLQGPFDVKAGVVIDDCKLSAMGARVPLSENLKGEMQMYPKMK